jgi:hypothetical protein
MGVGMKRKKSEWLREQKWIDFRNSPYGSPPFYDTPLKNLPTDFLVKKVRWFEKPWQNPSSKCLFINEYLRFCQELMFRDVVGFVTRIPYLRNTLAGDSRKQKITLNEWRQKQYESID